MSAIDRHHRQYDFAAPDWSEGRRTVMAERTRSLAGLRVVRGREDECRRHYATSPTGGDAAVKNTPPLETG